MSSPEQKILAYARHRLMARRVFLPCATTKNRPKRSNVLNTEEVMERIATAQWLCWERITKFPVTQ